MKRRCLSILLVLCMVMTLLPATAWAADSDFTIDENGVLTKYNGTGGDVVIPDGVTSIGYGAFDGCTSLTSITLPDSVTSIGTRAFAECSNLSSINIPNGVISIGYWSFFNCSNLTNINIPNSVTSIEEGAFIDCSGLTSITIPDGVGSINDKVFTGCTGLTSITIPNSVTSIGNQAFRNCSGLASITIPNDVTSIGTFAFQDCSNLTSFTAPDSVTSVGEYAFSGCSSLTSVTILNNRAFIGEYAFYNCNTLTSLAIPDSVTSTGRGPFYGCTSLTSITIPNGITSVGQNAFSNCDKLTSITIPDGVTSIEWGAFSRCSALTSVTIPDGVTSIGRFAFQDCSKLARIIIPNSVTSIGDNAFQGCGALSSVTIPDGVTSIGFHTFYDCSSLTNITIPNSITSIGDSAFYNCSGITSITIPDSVTSIGANAFENCSGLTSFSIPNGITSIARFVFQNCSGLTSITIPGNVTSIDRQAFAGCSSLSGIAIPDGVTSIGDDAFKNCSALTRIIIPHSVASIGYHPFSGCSGLTTAGPIGGGYSYEFGWTSEIPDNAFSGCSGLTNITIPGSVTSIGEYTFSNCNKLTDAGPTGGGYSYEFGWTSEIPNNAFSGCSGLTRVTIPASVTDIGQNAFSGCGGLSDIYYASSRESWALIGGEGKPSSETVTIHYNSTGPDDIGSDNMNPVYFLSGWDAATRKVQFGDEKITPDTYTVADSVDVSNINSLLNKYVLVTMEQGGSSLEYTITDIQPVESKIGTVSATGEHSLTIDGATYPVREDYVLASYDGEEVLYHVSNGTIMGFDVLEEKTGTLEAWDSATGKVTIDSKVYPTNYMSDLSFQSDIDQHLGKKITFFTSGNSNYTPLIRIDKFIEPESEIAVFSTEKSLTVQTGESMWLGFGKILDGQIVGDWKRMGIVVSDPTVISLSEYEETEYGYSLKVTGKKQGATNVTITDTESGQSTIIVISVRDSYVGTYSYAIDNMETFYPNNQWENKIQTNIYDLNGLYVNNYTCSKVGNIYTVSFDVYNSRYHTGAVDIYDANGNWMNCEEIKKYSIISSLWDTGEQAFYLISDLHDGRLLTYEQASSSKKSHVSFEVPADGYFTISNNFAESPGTFLFNSCDILYEGVFTLINAGVDLSKVEPSAFSGMIKEKVTENKTVRETFIGIFKKTVEKEVRSYGKRIMNGEIDGAYSDISGQLENLLSSLDISWKHLFKTATGVGESAFTKLAGPAGTALDGCFAFTKGSNQLVQAIHLARSVDAPYATVFSSIDKDAINSHGVIVNTNGNVDAQAELHVFRVSNNDTIEVVLDGDKDSHLKKYELYNICFVKNDQLVQPSGKVSVRIPIPNGMKKDTCNVYRQESDGTWTILTAHIEGNYLVFETDHFSLYGVVGEISHLSIISLPSKTQYNVGNILNPDGLVLSIDGELITTGFVCDPMVLSQKGEQDITVQYGLSSTIFTVSVQATSYTITFDAGSGTVTPSTVTTGEDGKLSILPTPTRSDYIFDGWYTTSSGGEKITTDYVFTSDTTVYAHWTKNSGGSSGGGSSSSGGSSSGGSSSTSYSITAGNSAHGSVSVSPKSASKGTKVTLTIQPDSGYELDSLVVKDTKGNAVKLTKESNTKDTFTMPNSKVTIDATFTEIEQQPSSQIRFTDVNSNTYYYDAVAWAMEQGITSGTTAITFSPDAPCTRAQIVTFLWRAAGSPVMGENNPFTDVTPGSYYYDAVQWAVAQGITVGTSANTFSPDVTCTRGQAVTFLYRYEKSPVVSGGNAFTDVPSNAYYTNAVQWAVNNGVTSGTSATTFSPNATCTRGQIVTFLYRDMA